MATPVLEGPIEDYTDEMHEHLETCALGHHYYRRVAGVWTCVRRMCRAAVPHAR